MKPYHVEINQVGAWRSPVSAPVLGTGGPQFESGRPDHFKNPLFLNSFLS